MSPQTAASSTSTQTESRAKVAIEFTQKAEQLGQHLRSQEDESTGSTQAVEAKFVTGQDPVIVTADGGRLPAVPLDEALKLNALRDELEGKDPDERDPVETTTRDGLDGTMHGVKVPRNDGRKEDDETDAPLSSQVPQSKTNPLFPPLPMWGPPSPMRHAQEWIFKISSAVLSFLFLMVIILGAVFTSIPRAANRVWCRIVGRDPDAKRAMVKEEKLRAESRHRMEREWQAGHNRVQSRRKGDDCEKDAAETSENRFDSKDEVYEPTEGGPDPLICDISYYARRVGLECETFDVQTEDGFILELWHLYNPLTQSPRSPPEREVDTPDVFTTEPKKLAETLQGAKYPVLMIHGLLQSAGAYCCTDDNSLAFYLAKSGLDVWLGNNRCGFKPRHALLDTMDPRMWAWNIRQMGVMDLPALTSRVLHETQFPKLALVAHSQGTTQTLVALAKEQRPDIGHKISIACLLAPAAYAGPLIGKMYFKFMRIISPGMFRAIFGIHAFIPFMMDMHRLLPGKLYGFMGYLVFSFLFSWSDERWDRGLRSRCFQFSPVYVSAESMRWWLGRECFATQRCILATREEGKIEEREDEEDDNGAGAAKRSKEDAARFAWYDENAPPMAMWVCGKDALVDGERLLRRFEKGREPFVELVHKKIIPSYEHLDVLWAMDAIDEVGKEVLECIWKTVPEDVRGHCRVPRGCEEIQPWSPKSK